LGKLLDGYATKQQKKIYNLIKPEELQQQDKKRVRLRFPEGFTTFQDSNPRFIPHIEAYKYLQSRGITDEMIDRYKIGYTVSGEFAYRVIIPSYDKEGILNYFVGRAWVHKKMKYKNPASVPKDEIIFNEQLLDWDKDIYLVEGAFDSFFLPNPLVMLGKKMSKLIFETLYNKANGNIIVCVDGDAWDDGLRIYNELNGGRLYNKIKMVKLPKDKDVCDLRGDIEEYYYEIK
jgi:DNA primase